MEKNSYLRFGATLLIICLASSGLLGVVFNMTHPKIVAQQKHEEEASLTDVLPLAMTFEPKDENGQVLYYTGFDSQKKICGYAFKAVKHGYSSDISTMVGLNLDGTINRIKILSQNETPGLGTRVTEVIQKETLWDILLKKAKISVGIRPWFQAQFDGVRADDLKNVVPVITGATITSSAVIDSIQEKAKEVMEKTRYGR